jgi:hypothetical protein
MNSSPIQEDTKVGPSSEKYDGDKREKILRSLQAILKSPTFRNSERCKQFLKYVVEHSVEGQPELLKERVIGTEVFGRRPDYATGDDPIVRVQASEVRKRLQQYYETFDSALPVQIDLPTGSYTPSFRFQSTPQPEILTSSIDNLPENKPKSRRLIAGALVILVTAIAVGSFFYFRSEDRSRSSLDIFWGPASGTPGRPILICIGQPVVYMPYIKQYQRYSSTNPKAFRSGLDRLTKALPLQPDEKLAWGDLNLADDLGIAVGDVYAAQRITSFLGGKHFATQTRIGKNYSFEDLRNSPSILIGAFNNRWTMQLTSKLRFAFLEDPGGVGETIKGGRQWRDSVDENGHVVRDYAIVARLLDSETGQFTVVVAGVMAEGTQGAAQLVTDNDSLRQILASAPPDWEKKNVEVVIETSATDLVASPPHVVATYFW